MQAIESSPRALVGWRKAQTVRGDGYVYNVRSIARWKPTRLSDLVSICMDRSVQPTARMAAEHDRQTRELHETHGRLTRTLGKGFKSNRQWVLSFQ